MQRRNVLIRQFIVLLLLFGLLFSVVFAQKKPTQPKPSTCTGAWTGNITFSRTQTLTDSKVTPRVSARGKDTRETELKLRYNASVAVLTAAHGPFFSDADLVEDSTDNAQSGDITPDFTKTVKLASKQSIELEIPVEQANNFGLTFMADSQISATLFNEMGEIVGKSLAKTPEASDCFRSIFLR